MPLKMGTQPTVPASYAAATAPDADAGFLPDEWLFWNEGNHDVLISFDGLTDQLIVKQGTAVDANQPMRLRKKLQRVWFKQSGGAGAVRWAANTDV
jgi:hypothetical protein